MKNISESYLNKGGADDGAGVNHRVVGFICGREKQTNMKASDMLDCVKRHQLNKTTHLGRT